MMLIVRMYPQYEVDKVWDYAEDRFSKYKKMDIVPLFMSQHDFQNFVSVVCEANEPDMLADFFGSEIAPCKEISCTRTVTLIKPAFFAVPKDIPENLCRFRVALRLDPKYYTKIYDKILKLKTPKNIFFAYVTYSFGEDDILISLLAENKNIVRDFVSESIENIEGVESVGILLTHKTKRLADDDVWRVHERKYSVSRFVPGAKPAGEDDFDWTYLDHCSLHGALPDES